MTDGEHNVTVDTDAGMDDPPNGPWWVNCSCSARWRIPKMATRALMEAEYEATVAKHKAYYDRKPTQPD